MKLSWELNPTNPTILDIFECGSPENVLMKISLAEANQAARKVKPGIVVDGPKFLPKGVDMKSESYVGELALSISEFLNLIDEFKKHQSECPSINENGVIFSRLFLKSESTSGIGQTITATCSCGKCWDITDVSNW